MPWWESLAWGLAGGLLVELLDLHTLGRQLDAWPWTPAPDPDERRPSKSLYLSLGLIRLLIGGILALAFGAAGQATTITANLMIGIGAPTIIKKLGAATDPADRGMPIVKSNTENRGGPVAEDLAVEAPDPETEPRSQR